MSKKLEAIQRLRPNAEFVLRGDVLEWMDETQTEPTEQEIADEIAYLEGDGYKKEQLQAELEAEARQIAMEEIINERLPTVAMANIKAKIDSGEINENARKALRDEIQKTKEK